VTDVTDEMMQAAWSADYAWWKSPDRERGGSWGSVPEAQLRRLLEAAAPLIAAAERERLAADGSRESLGALVREVWVEWAEQQAAAKPSWLVPWHELDEDQQQFDMRIGATVAAVARSAEYDRVIDVASQMRATIPADHPPGAQASFADYLRVTAAGDAP